MGSVASASAPEAAPAPVTRALDQDPPLPGEDVEGWAGLTPSADAAPDPHAGHRGHGGTP